MPASRADFLEEMMWEVANEIGLDEQKFGLIASKNCARVYEKCSLSIPKAYLQTYPHMENK
jgi:hypothetical protein